MTIQKIQFRISFLCGDKEYLSIEDLCEAIKSGVDTTNSQTPVTFSTGTPLAGILKESQIQFEPIPKKKGGRPKKKK